MSSNPGNTASQSSVLRRIEALHEEVRTSRRRTNERLDGLQSSFDELKRGDRCGRPSGAAASVGRDTCRQREEAS